jgi:hypothetical protein
VEKICFGLPKIQHCHISRSCERFAHISKFRDMWHYSKSYLWPREEWPIPDTAIEICGTQVFSLDNFFIGNPCPSFGAFSFYGSGLRLGRDRNFQNSSCRNKHNLKYSFLSLFELYRTSRQVSQRMIISL